jgi:hypothetical protein
VTGSCAASSAFVRLLLYYTCDKAFNGITEPQELTATGWSSESGQEGEWIQRNFTGMALITHMIVWYPCAKEDQYNTLNFTFSDGQSIQVFINGTVAAHV